ncbi:hypothetical protein, partial [Mesorhizobium sp. M00.F.Ca.ET.216.01.1.1]|uniref:hypothetical protein n=1 Tax=Mesorhizobium sp. M00.F.Ca.ET.216.01.1.1 TaxID=2500528 RepID=UPI001AEEF541
VSRPYTLDISLTNGCQSSWARGGGVKAASARAALLAAEAEPVVPMPVVVSVAVPVVVPAVAPVGVPAAVPARVPAAVPVAVAAGRRTGHGGEAAR